MNNLEYELLESWLQDAETSARNRNDKFMNFGDIITVMSRQRYVKSFLRHFADEHKNFENAKFLEDIDDFIIQYFDNTSTVPSQETVGISKDLEIFLENVRNRVSQNNDMGIKHFVIGLLSSYSPVYEIFKSYNITEKFISEINREAVREAYVEVGTRNIETTVIDKYTTDLTLLASKKQLDPIYGRETELSSLIYSLLMRNNNTPLLYGEIGVGRSTIVNSLAEHIINNEVPKCLENCRVVKLNLTSFTTASKNDGITETKNFKSLLNEVENSNGRVILFVDDAQMLIGTTYGSILKPYLDSGKILFIGSTTTESFNVKFSKDDNYQYAFQAIEVKEPTIEESINILKTLAPTYSSYHNIEISDKAIESAVEMSARYITDASLPAKAIQVLDEASARLKNELDSNPTILNTTKRELDRLISDEISLKVSGNTEELENVQTKISELDEYFTNLNESWTKESNLSKEIKEIRYDLSVAKEREKRALNNNEFNEASHITHTEIPALEDKLEKLKNEYNSMDILVPHILGKNQIASVIESKTGIPVGKLLQGEAERLLNMESIITKKVIGQDHIIKKLAKTIRRSRAGVADTKKPTGSFFMLGASGTGKTYTAKELTKFLFDDEQAMIRLDMSEYSEKHTVSRLVGAPPGYAGYDEGGQLTDAVRKRPYSVILFDEVEKAHKDVFDILLQVLDDGHLTDSRGRVVDFKNTIIMLTSNLGAKEYLNNDEYTKEEAKAGVMEIIKEYFRPEFLNRLDSIDIFNKFTKEDMRNIVHTEISELELRVQKSAGIKKITLSEEAVEWLAENGYDPNNGARPLRRLVNNVLGDSITDKILNGSIQEGQELKVKLDEENNTLTVQ